MPVSQVYADSNDCSIAVAGQDTFANIRATSTGNHQNTSTSQNWAVVNRGTAGRGAAAYFIYRSYFEFDLSGLSGTATDVSLHLYADNLGTVADEEASIFIVQSTALANSNADFNNCFSSGTTLGSILGIAQASTTEGYCDAGFNSGGISAVNSAIGSGTLTIGCLGYYDATNTAPTLDGNYTQIKLTYANYTGTSRDPYLRITTGSAAAATDNATFFGTNF